MYVVKTKNVIIIATIFVVVIMTVVVAFKFGDKIFISEPTDYNTQGSTTENTAKDFKVEKTEYIPKKPLLATGKALTEKEIKEFLPIANEVYMNWVNPGRALKIDWDNEITINGQRSCPVISGGLITLDAINEEVQSFFSEETCKERMDDMYLMHEGKLYICGPYGEGGDIGWNKFELKMVSSTPTECEFVITAYFEDAHKDTAYKMKVVDGKWNFVETYEWIDTLFTDNNKNYEWVE